MHQELEQAATEEKREEPDKNAREVDDSEEDNDSSWQSAEYAMTCIEIPLREAVDGPDGKEWKKAIYQEDRSLIENQVWEIVERPKNKKVIGTRIVLRNKIGGDGEVERRKARVVAKGFTQVQGVDYNESFSPVARLSSLRVLVAISATRKLKITQLDVTTAFLYGEIDTETYIEAPELLEETLEEMSRRDTDPAIRKAATEQLGKLRSGDQVCKLNRAIYGLKQAGRQWHEKLSSVLQKAGLQPTISDPCMYTNEEKTIVVLTYIDDLLVMTEKPEDEKTIVGVLASNFKIKDLGEMKFCLGIQVTRILMLNDPN